MSPSGRKAERNPNRLFMKPRTDRDMSKVKYYRCQKYGHYAKDCPNPRVPRGPPIGGGLSNLSEALQDLYQHEGVPQHKLQALEDFVIHSAASYLRDLESGDTEGRGASDTEEATHSEVVPGDDGLKMKVATPSQSTPEATASASPSRRAARGRGSRRAAAGRARAQPRASRRRARRRRTRRARRRRRRGRP